MRATTARNASAIPDESITKRRHRSKLERRLIVEESFEPGASVAVVARSHGVNANQVFNWRKLYREGRLDLRPASAQLMPVRVVDATIHEPGTATPPRTGTILLELGRTRIRLEGSVDPESLRIILEHLRR